MPTYKRFTVSAQQNYDVLVRPAFLPGTPTDADPRSFRGTLNEFTLMNDVRNGKAIVSIKALSNIMQRRDASCEIVYKKIMGTSSRRITTDEVYGATKLCQNELYQGCLKDWRRGDPVFRERILPFFKNIMYNDTLTNAYWGDISRAENPLAKYNTTSYNGIWYWIKTFTQAGIIPADQTIQIEDTTDFEATPKQAFDLIASLYKKMNLEMANSQKSELAFYVSQSIADAYEDYMVSTGQNTDAYVSYLANGLPSQYLAYKKIEIKVEPTWGPVMYELAGKKVHAAILTYRGNFIFGIDETYGEGPNLDEALRVWYSDDDMVWKYQFFLKLGTQIALPEHIVYAISEF